MITVVVFSVLSVIIFSVQRRYNFPRYFIFIPFFALLLFTVHNPDYYVYENAYLTGDSPFKEAIGLIVLFNFFHNLGVENIKIVLFFIGLFIFFMIRKWNKYIGNVYIILFLYSLFIMYYDVIQIRNMVSAFCICNALIIILFDYKKKNLIKVILLCMIAVSFHPLALLLIAIMVYVCIFYYNEQYDISNNEIVVLMVFAFANIIFGRSLLVFISDKVAFLWKIKLYMTQGADYKSLAIWGIAMIFMLFVLWNYGVKEVMFNNYYNLSEKRIVNILFRYICVGTSLVGATLYMDEIARLFRMMFLVGFVLTAYLYSIIPTKKSKYLLFSLAVENIAFMSVWMLRGIRFDAYW